MRHFIDLIYRGLQVALTLLIATLIFPVTWQIFSRYTPLLPNLIWTEEVSRCCLIWVIMIGASVAVRDGAHFDVDVLPHPKTQLGVAVSRTVVHGAIFLVALIFLGFGWRFTMFGYDQSSELTGLNMAFIHVAWPFAGFCWVLFTLEKLYDDIQLLKQAKGGANGAG